MANPERGEVSVEIKGKTYTLHFGTNAMCEVEALLSTPQQRVTCQQAQQQARAGVALAVRALLWGALRKYHSEVTLDGAGDLIDAGGPQLIAALQKTGELSAPRIDDVRALQAGARGRPPSARIRTVGTGRRLNAKH